MVKQKEIDYEKLRAKQEQYRLKAIAKAKEKQQALIEDRKEHPEKYYQKQQCKSIVRRTAPKCHQKSARKTKEPYQSIFTEDMNKCYITGDTYSVDPHHIFGGADKTSSELFHFMLPLRHDWHNAENYSIHLDRRLDIKYKMLCQDYWINEMGRTKEEWIKYFRKWYSLEDIGKSSGCSHEQTVYV